MGVVGGQEGCTFMADESLERDGRGHWLERKRGGRWMSSEWSNCRVVRNVEAAYTRAQIYYYVSPPIRKRLSLVLIRTLIRMQATLRIYNRPCDSLAHIDTYA